MRRHLGGGLIRWVRPFDPGAGGSSADLLARFVADRDPEAFAEQVRRHGRLVLAVCRRGTGHPQDAEDAFQAVFLVLARKAGRISRPEAVESWLYGVAVRVAGRARRAAVRRARREVAVAVLPDRGADPPEPMADIRAVVERELAALPARFRRAVELCDLGGLTRAEAAAAMGVPEGTVSSRLTTGRGLLAARLTRRGVTLGVAGLLAGPTADAARLVGPTVGKVLGGTTGEPIRALARWGGTDMITWARWAGVMAVAGVTVGAVTAWGGRTPADRPPPAVKESPKVVAKAPEPETKDAAPAGRPRMTRRVETPGGHAVTWSPGGSLLAVTGEMSVSLYDGRDLGGKGTCATGRFPVVVGFLADPPALITYQSGTGRINRQDRLLFWNVSRGQPDQSRPDHAAISDDGGGQPVGFFPDRSTALTEFYVTRREPDQPAGHSTYVASVFRQVEVKTGRVLRDVFRFEDGDGRRYRLSPDGKTLAMLAATANAVVLENWDIETGKRRWGKELLSLAGGRPERSALKPPAFSPDGTTLAVAVPRSPKSAGKPAPPGAAKAPPRTEYDGAEIRLYATADGAERGKPDEQSEYLNIPFQFSHDGRLLLGRRNGYGRDSLTIWDAQSGRLLKGWDWYAVAAFAPDRPVLAILEDTSYADGNTQVRQAVLALWEVGDLLK